MERKYRIITDEDWTSLEDQVNEYIMDGYRPVGGPFVFTQKDDNNDDQQLICQAMTIAGLTS